ncbi:MAG: DUF6498-containing protein [Betaproteobacteria bacterium]|jgi:hypothetical protein|nr:DUF6498-containing protein [Betaproteobacteria bacterium]
MDELRNPGALADLVTRHVVPLAGVLFLGWPAGNIMVLLALDTLLTATGLGLLVMIHITGLDDGPPGLRTGPVRWGRVLLALPIMLLLFGMLVGFPVFWMADGLWRAAALADPGFRIGIAAQVLASVVAFFRMHRTLERRYDDQRILAREFVFVIARWVVVAIAAFTGVALLLGPRFGGALLIVVYGAASVWFELYPSKAARFLRGRDAKPLEQVIAQDTVKDAQQAARALRKAKK